MTIDNSDAGIERAIVAAGAIKGPRITPEHIESLVVDEVFFTAEQGYQAGMKAEHPDLAAVGNAFPYSMLAQITVCVLLLRNGHKVVGVNEGPVSPENFDAELGRQYARQKAIDQIWPLEGYLLRDRMHQLAHAPQDPTGDLF